MVVARTRLWRRSRLGVSANINAGGCERRAPEVAGLFQSFNVKQRAITVLPAMAQPRKLQPLSSDGFNGYNERLQGAALKATRNAALLPSDLNFYRSLDRGLAKEVDASSARVLSLANRLLDLIGTADNSSSRSSKGKARLRDDDDVTDNFRSSVVDAMDMLFEKAVSLIGATRY